MSENLDNTFYEIPFYKTLVDESISYGIVQPGSAVIQNSVPVIRVNNFENGKINTDDIKSVDKEIEKKFLRTRLKGGELLITVVGSIGETAIATNEMIGWNVARAVSVANIKENYNIHYIKYCFKTRDVLHQIYGNTNNTVQPTLNLSSLKNILFTVPNKKIQDAIASILTAFDNKIELLQAQNKTLEETAQTIFAEWFGKYSVDDELPDGWRVGKLGDFDAVIADFVANGSFASLKENVTLYDYEEYALFMRNTDLKSGFVQKTYVDKRAYEFLSKTKLFGGEIIISNVGDVGSVHFCPYFDIPMTLGNNVIMLKSEFQYYFYTMFNSSIGQHLISSITGGSAQPKFNKTDFRNMGMLIPDENILIKFEDVASKLYLKILKNKEQIQTLTKTRDELLPRLMSGEVRAQR